MSATLRELMTNVINEALEEIKESRGIDWLEQMCDDLGYGFITEPSYTIKDTESFLNDLASLSDEDFYELYQYLRMVDEV